MSYSDSWTNDILNIGIALNGEKNLNQLLIQILQIGMQFTSSDAGYLYLLENKQLYYKLMHIRSLKLNLSMDDSNEMSLSPITLNSNDICAVSASLKQTISIPDIYSDTTYDFSATKQIDEMTGYHSQSMLVLPLLTNENIVLGVLQLVNSRTKQKKIRPYSSEMEYFLFYFATNAAMAISNINYTKETKDLLYSFAEVMMAAIEERTPYNTYHTHNVAKYTKKFVDYCNEQYKLGNITEYFDEHRIDQLTLAALLHDIGKIAIPLDVMNKPSRLSTKLDPILARFELFRAYYKIDLLEDRITKKTYHDKLTELDELKDFIQSINSASYLDQLAINQVEECGKLFYTSKDGTPIPYLTPKELECLSIRKGTLTKAERKIMENHVVITSRLLDSFNFQSYYSDIPKWARSHHEYLDGSGYPNHLTAKDIPIEVRILCIADIYDALTATDRPYKKPIEKETALKILEEMANEGKLDKKLVALFQDAIHSQGTPFSFSNV